MKQSGISRREFLRKTAGVALGLTSAGLIRSVAVPGWVQAQPASSTLDALVEKAKADGQLVFYTSWLAFQAEAVTRGFTKRFGIRSEFFNAGSPRILERYATEKAAGIRGADVIQVSDTPAWYAMRQANELTPFKFSSWSQFPDYALEGNGNFWAPDAWGMVILFNTKKIAPRSAPSNWKDLINNDWRGRMGVLDPELTSTGFFWYYALRDVFGPQYHEDLGKVGMRLFTSHGEMGSNVASGELWVAAEMLHYEAKRLTIAGAPVGLVYAPPTPFQPRWLGIPKTSPHPNAAKLFMEYMASPDGQKVIATESFTHPTRKGATGPALLPLGRMKLWTMKDANAYISSQDQLKREAASFYKRR